MDVRIGSARDKDRVGRRVAGVKGRKRRTLFKLPAGVRR